MPVLCGCSPPGTGTVCSASGKLTQQPATGTTNTAAQITLYYLHCIYFSTFLCTMVKMYLFSFVDLGSSGLKVLCYLLFTDETNKKNFPEPNTSYFRY